MRPEWFATPKDHAAIGAAGPQNRAKADPEDGRWSAIPV